MVSKGPDSAIDQNDEDDHFVLLKSKTGHVLYRHAVTAANFIENINRSYGVLNDTINLQKHIQKKVKVEFPLRALILRGMYFDPSGKDGFVYIDYFGPDDEVTDKDIFRLLTDSDDGYFKLPDESDEKTMELIIEHHPTKYIDPKLHLLLSDSYYEPVYQKMNWKK